MLESQALVFLLCSTTVALTCENLYSDGHVTLFYGNEVNLGHTLKESVPYDTYPPPHK